MTDQLLSAASDESPTALVPTNTSATSADGSGTTSAYSDVDYASEETEVEKPIILELGATPNATYSTTSVSAPNYPLDMHLTHGSSYLPSAQVYTGNADDPATHAIPLIASQHLHSHSHPHMALYSNPYTHHPLPAATSITPMHTGALHPGDYSTHIPQTVCAWATPDADMESKTIPEVVPPPMYISYVGVREHILSKEANPSWKEKALQIEKDYKKTACDRERTRMRDMNRAFDLLRSKLPVSKPNGKKYSKIESLRIAINYINHLQQCLNESPPEFDIAELPTPSKSVQHNIAVNYVLDMDDNRQREQTYHYESRKSSYKDIDKELDESHSGNWSDSNYIPNGQNQWD